MKSTHMFARTPLALTSKGRQWRQRCRGVVPSEHAVCLRFLAGRDKRKKKTGKKPGAGDAKTERKTERNEEKKNRRLERAAQVLRNTRLH